MGETSLELLARVLQLPMPTKIFGIHQSDIIIRTALESALEDMRAHPELLDSCFENLRQDPLTNRTYGVKEIEQIKQWFVKSQIPVLMTPTIDESRCPCLSIALLGSDEAVNEATLGDVNGEASGEGTDDQWQFIAHELKLQSYDRLTGTIVFKEVPMSDGYALAKTQYVIDRNGGQHLILEVLSPTSVQIRAGVIADFRGAGIKQMRPTRGTDIESSSFRENYRIGVHVLGEPKQLMWLHTIVVFALLRYKEILLEARGFERSTFGSTDFVRDMQFDPQFAFSRYVTISGYVRQYWPKAVKGRVDVIDSGGIEIASNREAEPKDPEDMWTTIKDDPTSSA